MFGGLKTRVFADGAELDEIVRLADLSRSRASRRTRPSCGRPGLTDYTEFAHRLLEAVPDRPISFEVFADDAAEMRRQARVIAERGAPTSSSRSP